MEALKVHVNVLREIALRRPNAHLAFLCHDAYRKLYNNEGQLIIFTQNLCKVIDFDYDFWVHEASYTSYASYTYSFDCGEFSHLPQTIQKTFRHDEEDFNDDYSIEFCDGTDCYFADSWTGYDTWKYFIQTLLPHLLKRFINRKQI